MALSETAIIEKLQKLFPSRIIFADQYLKRTGILSYEVYKIAKENKQTRTEWFSAHGFIWKETGYVESDMLSEMLSILLTIQMHSSLQTMFFVDIPWLENIF